MFRVNVQKNRNTEKGYTLLELTLVLAIIAVIATFALKLYRDAAESNRVNKVSLEMQHIMEAALAYNVANNFWPVDNVYGTNPDCTTPRDTTFVNTYLPNQTNSSSYGIAFCWSGANDGTGTSQNPTPNYPKFWIALKLPGGYIKTAQQVAGMLPNAIATADVPQAFVAKTNPPSLANTPCTDTTKSCYIRAEVPLPGVAENGNGNLQVKAVGNCMPHNPQDHTAGRTCVGSVCHFTPQAGVPSSVICQQMTSAVPDTPGNTTDTEAKSRLTYQVLFSCPGNLQPALIVTPNFLTMPRYYSTDLNADNGKYDLPVYQLQLDRWPVSSTDLYGNTVKVTCTTSQCEFVMGGTIGGRTPGAPGVGKLITHYGSGPKPVGDGWPENPGALGASYIAICQP